MANNEGNAGNEGFDRAAVHKRLGVEATSDHELDVMLDVLQGEYAGRDLAGLNEAEWLRAYGLMHQRKQTGWMTEGVAMNVDEENTAPEQ